MMGRRRVNEKHIPMSLSMPYALIQRVDKQLSYKASRSKWVQNAIIQKLDENIDLSQISDMRLMKELFFREECNDFLKRQIKLIIFPNLSDDEIEKLR